MTADIQPWGPSEQEISVTPIGCMHKKPSPCLQDSHITYLFFFLSSAQSLSHCSIQYMFMEDFSEYCSMAYCTHNLALET